MSSLFFAPDPAPVVARTQLLGVQTSGLDATDVRDIRREATFHGDEWQCLARVFASSHIRQVQSHVYSDVTKFMAKS